MWHQLRIAAQNNINSRLSNVADAWGVMVGGIAQPSLPTGECDVQNQFCSQSQTFNPNPDRSKEKATQPKYSPKTKKHRTSGAVCTVFGNGTDILTKKFLDCKLSSL
eukprot:1791028-Amphidinium_carterae.1